jgi:hypothetical protein
MEYGWILFRGMEMKCEIVIFPLLRPLLGKLQRRMMWMID